MTGPWARSARAARNRWVRMLAPPLAYLVGSVALTSSVWSHPGTELVGAGSNPSAKVWFLAFFAHGLATGHLQLLTHLTTAPHTINLMWNNSILAISLLLAPITLTLGPVVAYNVAMTVGLAASGWVAGLALRRYVRHPASAWAGGAIFGFSPFILAEADSGHLLWVTLWPIPVLLLLLDSLVRTRRPPAWLLGIGMGVWIGLEMLTSEELVTTCALVSAGTLLALAATHRHAARALLPRVAAALAVALPVALLIAGAPLAVQFLGPHRLVMGVVEPPAVNVADLFAVVMPTELQAAAPPFLVAITQHFTGYPFDRVVYLGVPLLVFLGWVVLAGRRDPRVRLFAALAAAVTVLALGSHLHVDGRATGIPLPWSVFARLPLVSKALPSRLMAVTWLAVATLVALGIDRLAERPGGAARARSAVLVGAVALSLVPAGGELTSGAVVPAFFRTALVHRVAAGGTLLTTPIPNADGCTGLLWQAASGFAYTTPTGCLLHAGTRPGLIVSYAGSTPLRTDLWRTQAGTPVAVTPRTRPALLAQLRVWRVRAVAVGPGPGEAVTRSFLSALLQQRPDRVHGVWLFTVSAAAAP